MDTLVAPEEGFEERAILLDTKMNNDKYERSYAKLFVDKANEILAEAGAEYRISLYGAKSERSTLAFFTSRKDNMSSLTFFTHGRQVKVGYYGAEVKRSLVFQRFQEGIPAARADAIFNIPAKPAQAGLGSDYNFGIHACGRNNTGFHVGVANRMNYEHQSAYYSWTDSVLRK